VGRLSPWNWLDILSRPPTSALTERGPR
jgi:hypothetical protein